MAAWAPAAGTAQKVPIVWDVQWDIQQPGDSSASMPDKAWQDALSSALTLRPPQRILGLPMQHAANRVLGRWQKAWERGDPAPPGSASAFDRVSMEQSERLFASRMLRMGCLDAAVRLDTTLSDHRVTLQVHLNPGRRTRCGTVTVLGE
ncbi:MAG: hypothetical protein ACPGGB_10600, partial [Flavobacteriales bacterium]